MSFKITRQILEQLVMIILQKKPLFHVFSISETVSLLCDLISAQKFKLKKALKLLFASKVTVRPLPDTEHV